MTPDPLDQWSARLFEAVREEPPPEGAEQRVLARARRELPARRSRRVAQALLLAAAFALVAAFVARRREPPSPLSAEPDRSTVVRGAPQRAPAQSPPVEAPASAPRLDSSATPSRTKNVVSAQPSAAASAPLNLEDELKALKSAESALNAGDAARALELLNRYDASKGQRMRAEATLLRIEALSRSGRRDAASQLAKSFVAANPGSPLVDRARSFIMQEEHDE